jgi:hypothetical protein
LISYIPYKLIHLLGVFATLSSLFSMAILRLAGLEANSWPRPILSIIHGVGLFLILLGGLGMLAHLGIGWPFPAWIAAKISLWLLLGGLLSLMKRAVFSSQKTWALVALCVPLIGMLAAVVALYKL